jgi:alpha-mannosidase
MLDTLLISRGERQRRFRLGIGIDLAYPLHEALGLLAPQAIVPDVPRPSSGASGWLVHLGARNVIATSLRPLVEASRVVGFAARLLEIAGRPASLTVTAFRPIQAAATVDFLGSPLATVKIEDGKAKLDLAANEWTELHARW